MKTSKEIKLNELLMVNTFQQLIHTNSEYTKKEKVEFLGSFGNVIRTDDVNALESQGIITNIDRLLVIGR